MNRLLKISGWTGGHKSLSLQLNWACNEIAILTRLFPGFDGLGEYKRSLRGCIAATNERLFQIVEEFCSAYESGSTVRVTELAAERECAADLQEVLTMRNACIGRNQAWLLEQIDQRKSAGPLARHFSSHVEAHSKRGEQARLRLSP